MAKVISIFSHKGGVGKTTFSYGLAYALSTLNHRVLLIDGDSQSNLTSIVTNTIPKKAQKEDENLLLLLDNFEKEKEISSFENIFDYLTRRLFPSIAPIKTDKPFFDKKIDDEPHAQLSLLCGSMKTAEFDVDFTDIKSNNKATMHLPGAFQRAIQEAGKDYEFVIIDLSPSLGFFNMFSVMSSNYLIVPVNPGLFSASAMAGLGSAFQKWNEYISPYKQSAFIQDGINAKPKFLGFISQCFRPFDGTQNQNKVVKAFRKWQDVINQSAKDFASLMSPFGMSLTEEEFRKIFTNQEASKPFAIENISDFNRLAKLSEACGVPCFALTRKMVGKFEGEQLGEDDVEKLKEFKKQYSYIAKSIANIH